MEPSPTMNEQRTNDSPGIVGHFGGVVGVLRLTVQVVLHVLQFCGRTIKREHVRRVERGSVNSLDELLNESSDESMVSWHLSRKKIPESGESGLGTASTKTLLASFTASYWKIKPLNTIVKLMLRVSGPPLTGAGGN